MKDASSVTPKIPKQEATKRYSVNAGYKDLGRALARRGWLECPPNDRYMRLGSGQQDEGLDLQFTLASGDTSQRRLKEGAITNHNRGEACLTCKTDLLETLGEA